MNWARSKWVMAVGFAIVGAVTVRLVLSSTAAMLLAAAIGMGVGLWVAMRLAARRPPDLGKRAPLPLPEMAEERPAEAQAAELFDLLGQLARANLAARLAGFDAGLLAPLEALIDDLRPALEAMMARHPGDRLTWELGRLCDRHVPRLVQEYADLSAAAREARRADMARTLATLSDQIRRTAELVARDEADEFMTAANVIAAKFGAAQA